MNRLTLCLLVAMLAPTTVFAQAPPGGILWQAIPKTALETARREQRPLVVYFTADYCTYCRKLEGVTWAHPEVAKLISTDFVPLKIDGDKLQQVATAMQVDGFPDVVIVAPTGEELERVSGYVGPDEMLASLRKVAAQSRSRMARAATGTN